MILNRVLTSLTVTAGFSPVVAFNESRSVCLTFPISSIVVCVGMVSSRVWFWLPCLVCVGGWVMMLPILLLVIPMLIPSSLVLRCWWWGQRGGGGRGGGGGSGGGGGGASYWWLVCWNWFSCLMKLPSVSPWLAYCLLPFRLWCWFRHGYGSSLIYLYLGVCRFVIPTCSHPSQCCARGGQGPHHLC